eukprot:symbB.v1.2.003958.t1/scaffold170.1/size288889/4
MLESVRLSAQAQVLCNLMEKYGVKCEVLRLSGNQFGNDGLRCVAKYLASSCKAPVLELLLTKNRFNMEGLAWLLGCLAMHPAYPVWDSMSFRYVPIWLRVENSKVQEEASHLSAVCESLSISICPGERIDDSSCAPRKCLKVGCSEDLKHNCVAHMVGTSWKAGQATWPLPAAHAKSFFEAPGKSAPRAPPTGAEEPLRQEPRIVYEDADLAVVFKPCGWSSHPHPEGVDPSWAQLGPLHRRRQVARLMLQADGAPLQGWILLQFGSDPMSEACRDQSLDRGIVHRLDTDASGPLLIGKTMKGFEHARKQILLGLLKDYVVLVHGCPSADRGECHASLDTSGFEDTGIVRADPKGQPSITLWEVLVQYESDGEKYSLVHCRMATLRTHQLRVHMQYLGHPVVGDTLYGGSLPAFCRSSTSRAELALSAALCRQIQTIELSHGDFSCATGSLMADDSSDLLEGLHSLDITACKEHIRHLQARRERRRELVERLQEKLKALNNELAARKEEADRCKKDLLEEQAKNRRLAETRRGQKAGKEAGSDKWPAFFAPTGLMKVPGCPAWLRRDALLRGGTLEILLLIFLSLTALARMRPYTDFGGFATCDSLGCVRGAAMEAVGVHSAGGMGLAGSILSQEASETMLLAGLKVGAPFDSPSPKAGLRWSVVVLLHANRTASSGEPIAAIFHLSDCAALVMEDWSPDVPAYALAWTCGTTRNHKALWQEFLAHEALTDQTLQEQFLILHKIGPPPAYLRTLLGTCVDNLLSLWENFVLFQHEKTGSGTVLQAQAQLFNSTDCNLEAWQSECTLQLKMLPTCPADLSVLQVGLHERRAELVLQADSAAGTLQLVMKGHTWPWRSHLNSWMSGYVSADGQPSQKGDGSFMRWTAPFAAAELGPWLKTLHNTHLQLTVMGSVEAAVMEQLHACPF